MTDALIVIMRWLHLASLAALLGGLFYARVVVAPALGTLAADAARALADKTAAAFRPYVLASAFGLVISGSYSLLTNPGHSVKYHILLGAKLLLVMHVLAVAFLTMQPGIPRRARMMTGTLISGAVIIAIAAYLRRIF
jgi:hypothetical protein